MDLLHQAPPPELNRSQWTLQALADQLRHHPACPPTVNPEAVRRMLQRQGLRYRQAKEWLQSPDPLYDLHKQQRDRLLRWAREAPDGAAVWLDQSWFSRWPYRYRAWAAADKPLHVAKRWNEKVETTALYAALDDESQEALLQWAEGQPNSARTIRFLEALMQHATTHGKRFLVLFWDRAAWHTARRTRQWIRAYNRRAKAEGHTRLLVCYHPARSPWLMPLEAVFGWVKHHVLGDRGFDTLTALQTAVERSFQQRVEQAKPRRDRAWDRALAQAG